MSIRKNGIHKLIGENIRLFSGPGCPVCVTSEEDIDKVVFLSTIPHSIICTFGDMVYVPGTENSLAGRKSEGADVRTVYSVEDALTLATENPGKKIIFISIGFETTAPTAAAAVIRAAEKRINNFFIFGLNKTMPAALHAVLSPGGSKIDALICPGHVTTITGTDMYRPLVDDLGIFCCVAGFEPVDILRAIYDLTGMFEEGNPALVNAYERVVRNEGNIKAKKIMNEVFIPADASWRGMGIIPRSGLKISEKYADFDAEKEFEINIGKPCINENCICGDILRGMKDPDQCRLFGKACTPSTPKGACMVSSEGACAAWYKYGR
jgi:hydrogenase expression/formation protein HypD